MTDQPVPKSLELFTKLLADKSHDELVDLATSMDVKENYPEGASTEDLFALFRVGIGGIEDLDRDTLLHDIANRYDCMFDNYDTTVEDYLALEW